MGSQFSFQSFSFFGLDQMKHRKVAEEIIFGHWSTMPAGLPAIAHLMNCSPEPSSNSPWQIWLLINDKTSDDLASASPENIGFFRVQFVAEFGQNLFNKWQEF